MRFLCECSKQFIYTGKKIVNPYSEGNDDIIQYEYNVCPFCGSLNFDEIKEELVKEETVSLKDVPNSEVDEWLKQGYKIHAIYAKNTILTKSEATKQ